MTGHRPQFVVAYDFTPSAEEALIRAIDAATRAPQHVLHVVAALDPSSGVAAFPTGEVSYTYAADIQARIAERVTAALAGRDAHVTFFVHARIGDAAGEILSLAREIGADLVFVGSHGRTGLARALLGSVSERVAREAHCPVLVARRKEYAEVDLQQVVAADHPAHRYVRPHRYSYVDQRVLLRSDEWPL